MMTSLLTALCAPCLAQQTATATATATAGTEPAVQRTVVEDESVRIDELRVRGQTTRMVVQPKGGRPAYEIITADGWRDVSEGASSTRGAAGKRVWNLMSF